MLRWFALPLLFISFSVRADLRDRPRSFFGTSAATIYEIGNAKKANLLIEGNSAQALFESMTAVAAEHEAVSGPEGSVLYYHDIKRGAAMTCMLEREVYSCSLDLSDRTTGRVDSAPR